MQRHAERVKYGRRVIDRGLISSLEIAAEQKPLERDFWPAESIIDEMGAGEPVIGFLAAERRSLAGRVICGSRPVERP